MVRPIGFGPPVPLMQAAGDPPAGGGSSAVVIPGGPPSPPVAPSARPVTVHDGVAFVDKLGWVPRYVSAGTRRSTDSRDQYWFYPKLGAALRGSLRRVQNGSQLEIAATRRRITGDQIIQAARKLDPEFLKESITICLENIVNGTDHRAGVDNDYYRKKLIAMLASPYRGGADEVTIERAIDKATNSVRYYEVTPDDAATQLIATEIEGKNGKKYKPFELSLSAATSAAPGSADALPPALTGYPLDAFKLAKELVSLNARQAGTVLTDGEVSKRAEELLKDDYRYYKEMPSAMVSKLESEVEAAKEKQAKENSKQFSGYFLSGINNTSGPNGEKNKAGEDRTGMAGLTLAGGVGWKITNIFGLSLGAHYSGGKTDPLNGMPPRFHYFGGQNKTTSSGLAIDEAVFTAAIPFDENEKLSLNLKFGITDLDARGELSADKVLGLSGTTYGLAKYSPIYSSPLGGSFDLIWKASPSVSVHVLGALGKLAEYKLDNSSKAVAAADSAGDDAISKELRVGFQWAANPAAPKEGHLVALQGQLYNSDKTSYGAYSTAQFQFNPTWAIQASGRLFSLDDGESSDMAGYAALKYRFPGGTAISVYTSYVNRTKDEKGATIGVAAVDVREDMIPNDGVMTDKSVTSIMQFGGEGVFPVAGCLSVTGVLGGLRTNPQSGSEENANLRLFSSLSLKCTF